MAYYITYGEFQHQLRDYYLRTNHRMQFIEMAQYLYKNNMLESSHPSVSYPDDFQHLSDHEFDHLLDSFVLELSSDFRAADTVAESDIFPIARDVFIIRHPRYTRPSVHRHNYFEINYVIEGSCTFTFEDSVRQLNTGDLCIIAPGSDHDIIIDDESTAYTIMLRKSTFERSFFSLLSQKDLLSYFFRTLLQDKSHTNYLLFSAVTHPSFKYLLRNAITECHKSDSYSNISCISWINLMFSTLLRNYHKTLQFYDYQIGEDFSLILQYIQHNYQTVTLSGLAKIFHYSEPHISTLIKRHTGHTFTNLVKRLRMADAAHHLIYTDMKIHEISDLIGYHSADHFSRIFRSTYEMSPQAYRKANAPD